MIILIDLKFSFIIKNINYGRHVSGWSLSFRTILKRYIRQEIWTLKKEIESLKNDSEHERSNCKEGKT